MQTFLPYPDFKLSSEVLDLTRLGCERSETKQILSVILEGPTSTSSWRNHPAVIMWKRYPYALALYGQQMCKTWVLKGKNDSLLPYFTQLVETITDHSMPWWLGNKLFHKAHRSKLVSKLPEHYSSIFKDVNMDDSLPYLWPLEKEDHFRCINWR